MPEWTGAGSERMREGGERGRERKRGGGGRGRERGRGRGRGRERETSSMSSSCLNRELGRHLPTLPLTCSMSAVLTPSLSDDRSEVVSMAVTLACSTCLCLNGLELGLRG